MESSDSTFLFNKMLHCDNGMVFSFHVVIHCNYWYTNLEETVHETCIADLVLTRGKVYSLDPQLQTKTHMNVAMAPVTEMDKVLMKRKRCVQGVFVHCQLALVVLVIKELPLT